MDMKRFFLYFIVIAALALAGCGGNGGGGTPGDDMSMTMVDVSAIRTALGLAADADQAAILAAIMALDGDSDVLAAVRSNLMLDNNADQAAIIAAIDALRMEQMAPTEDPASAAIAPAIADPDGDGMPTGGLMKSERPNVAGGPSDRESRGTDAGMHHIRADAGSVDRAPTIRVGGGIARAPGFDSTAVTDIGDTLNKDDMTGTAPNLMSVEDQFELASYSVPNRGDFTGEVHERTVDKVTDKLKIYTNIDDAKSVAYDDYYDDIAATPTIGTAADRAGVASATAEGVLTLTARADLTAAATALDATLFSGSFFPTDNNSFKTLPGDNDPDTDADENEVSGMFNNIPGTFACGTSGGACTATKDNEGKIVLTGAWTFTPDADNLSTLMIPGVSHDADYLAFGYWVQITEQADGTMKHGIQTFATGSQPYTLANAQRAAITGRATYNGAAAGHFVRKEGPIGSAVATSSGHFTAAARLVAIFGQTTGTNADSIAPNQLSSITGTVSNFTDVDGNAIDAAWQVNLMKAGFAASGATHNAAASDLPTDTFGGNTTGGGSWEGRFFGPAADADGDEVSPSGVAGEFNAHFGNGHVVGAFGATR